MPIKTEIHSVDDGLVIERVEYFDGHVDACKAMHNEGLHGDKDMPLYASIPAVFIEDYLNRNNVTFAEFMNDQAHMKRFLNDPALSAFRIAPGRV